MRLKSEIWVHAFLRRAFAQGLYGAVLRKGAAQAREEAGPVMARVRQAVGMLPRTVVG